jgi:uracil DNA glycosylase
LLERRAVAIALRHLRRLRSRSGADFVEQLTDKTERVNLIVVLAGRETQQLGPQVSKPWCALPRRPHGSPYSLAKDTMETAARDHRAKIHITSGCSPDSC